MDEYIKRNNVISAVCFGCNQEFSDEPCEPDACAIRQSIMTLPTADVVPKSEVERAYQRGFERGKRDNVCGFSAEDIARKCEQLAIELEAMRTAANSYKMHYENARAEVAREIFKEIETYIKQLRKYQYCNNPLAFVFHILEEKKKKYTEGETMDEKKPKREENDL